MTLDVVIVGAGFGGLCVAHHLARAGRTEFVVLDRGDEVGGTWRDNVYPGCACDVRSHLYSFSFAPNPGWTHAYARQPEILAYLRDCADRFALRPYLRFGEAVSSARFDDATATWEVHTVRGSAYRARALVWAGGSLSTPARPDLPGLASFDGPAFHSAGWDPGVDLRGKRVAVIGTGASAVQFVPELTPQVARLDLYQRTAPWVLPRADRRISALEQGLFRAVPLVQRLARASIYLRNELLAVGFVWEPRLLRLAEWIGRRHLARQVSDPALRRALTPTYAAGCKRLLMSNDYYPALTRDHVSVVTDPIREVVADGVVTADGRHRPADVLIFGTGFQVHGFVTPGLIVGRGGRDLAATWSGGAEAYKGTTVSGFPNLFLILGPNTGLGHSSMVYVIESQARYVLDALRQMRERGWSAVEVRPEIQAAFNHRLQTRLGRTIWQTGCRSWYLDADGRNTALWPGSTVGFRWATTRFDVDGYQVDTGPTTRGVAG